MQVVAFADIRWDGARYSRHQLVSRIALRYPTLIVSQPISVWNAHRLSFPYDGGLTRVGESLWSYSPPRWLPRIRRPAIASRATTVRRAGHLERVWQGLGFDDPMYYVWSPEYIDFLERLPRRFTCYHCYDKYEAYAEADPERARSLEKTVLRGSDLAIASSSLLAEDLRRNAACEVVHLPHAVDFERFGASGVGVAPELEGIPRPRIGYVARMDERLDTDVIEHLARSRPDWSLVLIGPLGFSSATALDELRQLAGLPNVHLLGCRPADAIPALLHALDVTLLCYRLDNWGRYVQPIKAYEYLACGKPVVSSDIQASREMGNLVRVATDAESWVREVGEALATDSEEKRRARIDYARSNTWDQRAEQLIELLESASARYRERAVGAPSTSE
jgi:glycosyltransferase involved in cell wall biosynthesis